MKIKALKNLIVFGAFAFILFSYNSVFAYTFDTAVNSVPIAPVVVPATAPTVTPEKTVPAKTVETTPIATDTNNVSRNNLTALSLNGSGGFMPSSIWQWLLVIVLILAIIIFSRLFVEKPDPSKAHH